MRVAHISLHGCIRAQKIGWSWVNSGMKAHLIAQQIASTHSANGYESVTIFDPTPTGDGVLPDGTQLYNSVKILEPHVDVFHVHNEPNWIFKVVREATQKPVIWDIHDWTSLRKVEEPVAFEVECEKFAIEYADGFVVPSMGYLRKIRSLTKKPSALIYSMVPQFLFPPKAPVENHGLVYEGGVKGKTDIKYNYAYRNWADFAQKVVNTFTNGHQMYFYTANGGEDLTDYAHDRIRVSEPLIYPNLMQSLSTHTAGLVGSPFAVGEFDDAMPNKLFEYVASGIPCVVINSPEAKEYVERNHLGVGIQDAGEVAPALERLKDHKIFQDRWGYTMESQLPRLHALYQEVVCLQGPRMIAQEIPTHLQ